MSKKCPFCGEEVAEEAKICKHCKSNLSKACPFCGEEVSAQAVKCKHCGSTLDQAAPAAAPGGAAAPAAAPQKSGLVTAVGVVMIVLGVLSMCGAVSLLFLGGVAAAFGTVAAEGSTDFKFEGADDQQMQKAREDLRKAGRTAQAVGGLALVAGLVYFVNMILGIVGGIGVIARKKWGRMMGLIVGGLGALGALFGLVAGGLMGIPGFLIGGGISAFILIVLLNNKYAAEFA